MEMTIMIKFNNSPDKKKINKKIIQDGLMAAFR